MTIPCRHHVRAAAMLVAWQSLEQLRHGRGVPSNTAISQKEHEFAETIMNIKLGEYSSHYNHAEVEEMPNDDMIVEETMTTMIEHSYTTFQVILDDEGNLTSASNKGSATVTPNPQEGYCTECNATAAEYGSAFCGACCLRTPEGRAKRARLDDEVATDMCCG